MDTRIVWKTNAKDTKELIPHGYDEKVWGCLPETDFDCCKLQPGDIVELIIDAGNTIFFKTRVASVQIGLSYNRTFDGVDISPEIQVTQWIALE